MSPGLLAAKLTLGLALLAMELAEWIPQGRQRWAN